MVCASGSGPVGGVVSVEPGDADALLVSWTRVGHRRVYSHADGGVGCVSQEAKRPGGAFSRGERVGAGVCLDLYDERDVRWQDDVAGCLVEVAGCLGHGDGQGQVCAVVVRPGVEVVLEGQGDAGAAVGGFYGDVVGHGHVVEDRVGVVVEAESGDPVGLLLVGSDERGPYEIAVALRPYQFPVQAVVPAGEGFWERNEGWVGDLLGEQGADRLCFFFRRGWADVEVARARPGRRDAGPAAGGAAGECSQGVQGAGDVEGHGLSPCLGRGGLSVVASSGPGGSSSRSRGSVGVGAPAGPGGRAPGRAFSRRLIIPRRVVGAGGRISESCGGVMRIGGWSFTGWRRRSGAALGVVLGCDLVVWTAAGWSRPVGWVMAGVAACAVALVVVMRVVGGRGGGR